MDGSTTSISVDPRQQLDDVVDFVNDSWLASTDFDGPTFLWNHMISDSSAQDDDNRNNVPVAAPNEVADVIGLTMQWYFDSISSTVPTAERTEDGVSMPRNDMPTFRIDSQALSGVDAVVGNALMSTRWVDATTRPAAALQATEFALEAADIALPFAKDNAKPFTFKGGLNLQGSTLSFTGEATDQKAQLNTTLNALALQLASNCVAAGRWRLIMHRIGVPGSFAFYLRSFFKGALFNQGLPTSIGGDGLRILDAARRCHRR